MSRAWAAATVAAVRAQRERAPSAAAGAAARDRLAALAAARAAADDGRRQAGADESLRRAMYLSCWGPS